MEQTNMPQVITISFGFLLLFTAFISSQNISSKIMKDLGFDNLGFINIAIVYLTFAGMSMFAIPVKRKLGTRITLAVSTLTYALWIAAFLLPAYKYEYIEENGAEAAELVGIFDNRIITAVTIVTAVLLGLGAGPLWVS